VPAVLLLGAAAGLQKIPAENHSTTLTEDRPETWRDIVLRGIKIYGFVAALVLLGHGFTPVVDQFLVHLSPALLYWINTVSAILDNATLAAAEVTPKMSAEMIRYLLLGLLIAGGMLIPGNIPNIICAGKLSIKSKEWMRVGAPLGILLLVVYFILLSWVGPSGT
jgi:predicted cation transporter